MQFSISLFLISLDTLNKSTDLLFPTSFITTNSRWIKNYIISIFTNHLIKYPTPININYAWSFGSLAGICLIIQILTGI